MVNTIIVENEVSCCEVLTRLLKQYCPEVNVLSCHSHALEAIEAIKTLQPPLVFLNIELPEMNGFEILEHLAPITFDLIFTSSYEQHALKAIHLNPIDYLLKPINPEELQKAVHKAVVHATRPFEHQMEALLQKINHPTQQGYKIAMPTLEGLQIVAVDQIIYCESKSNYSSLILKNGQKIVVSKTLKEIEVLLQKYSFIRCHHSYLVNSNEINKYIKGEGGYLVMSNGTNIDVSRSRKDAVLKKLLGSEKE